MTQRTVLLIQNARRALDTMTAEELYHLAGAVRDELARRQMPAVDQAAALHDALLLPARVDHLRRTISDL